MSVAQQSFAHAGTNLPGYQVLQTSSGVLRSTWCWERCVGGSTGHDKVVAVDEPGSTTATMCCDIWAVRCGSTDSGRGLPS